MKVIISFIIGMMAVLITMAMLLKPQVKLVKEVEVERGADEKLIGLISDTHIPTRAKAIPSKVFEAFSKVDLIIHAGDFVDIGVLEELEKIAPVIGVHGNMDFDEVIRKLPKINYVEIDGRRIGIVHDAGSFGTEKMKRIAKENDFDVLIFGHTHRQFFTEEEGRIFINPGSATNPIPPFLVKPSVALLKVGKGKIEVSFIQL